MSSLKVKVLFTAIAAALLVVVIPTFAAAPEPVPATIETTTTSTVIETTTTTTTVPVAADARCPMWWAVARQEGFTADLMATLDRVIFRESRCDDSALNATDPNGGSIGLTQINRFWCLPSRYYADGYLQAVGVLSSCDELYDPAVNLRAALALVEYSRQAGLDQWAQWWWLAEGSENDQDSAG